MEVLLIGLFWLVFLLDGLRSKWSTSFYFQFWSKLFLLSGILGIGLAFFPNYILWPSRILLLMIALSSVQKFFSIERLRVNWVDTILDGRNALLLILYFFLFVRHLVPNFDVDSLSYHLPSIRWLFQRGAYPIANANIDNVPFTYRIVGFEEFLTGMGANLNLSLFAGMIGGFLKAVSLGTVIAISSRRNLFGMLMVCFFLLIDDHFLFSGQNTSVYLNPSFIGVFALTFYFSLLAFKKPSVALPRLLAMSLGLITIKLYGLFSAAYCFVTFFLCVFVFWNNNKIKFALGKKDYWPFFGGLLLVFSVYGVNFIETGMPLFPISNPGASNVHPGYIFTGKQFPRGEVLPALLHPKKTLVFSGVMAYKFVFVFIFLAALVLVGNALKPTFFAKSNLRRLSFSLASFFLVFVWCVTAEYFVSQESRYPRYALGIGIFGICNFLFCLRAYLPSRLFVFRRIHTSWMIGTYCAYLFLSLDHRYYNLQTYGRPTWSFIFNSPLKSLENEPELFTNFFYRFTQENFTALHLCLSKIKEAHLPTELSTLVYAPSFDWPAYLVGSSVLRGDPISNFSIPKKHENTNSDYFSGLKYIILPKKVAISRQIPPLWRQINTPLSLEYLQRGIDSRKIICESKDMVVVEL